jgi:hypothetical protein
VRTLLGWIDFWSWYLLVLQATWQLYQRLPNYCPENPSEWDNSHDWDGHVEEDYPVPFCRHCGKCYDDTRYERELALGWHQ